jgi:Cd2+/Zn2+-exporting ATPase
MSDSCEEGSACAVDFSKESEENVSFTIKKEYIKPVMGLVLLLIGIAFDYFEIVFFSRDISLIWFGTIYLLIGGPIVVKALKLILKGNFYNEFVLMSLATIGAFLIGAYAEGVSVMLFYFI